MMTELTADQRQQMKSSGWPPSFRDMETGESFVLIHQEMYDRIKALLEKVDEIKEAELFATLALEVFEKE
ncbi:hypothetical protein BH10PLA2_BH10PLA2_36620 [soil metagenome]